MHRFYINQDLTFPYEITDHHLLHQIVKVLRFRKNEHIILLNGNGKEYVTRLDSIASKSARFSLISEREPATEPESKLTLFQAIIKKDKFEWVIQKATEIGISRFVPVLCDRSEKKNLSFERLHTIIIEAVEQSGRVRIPEIRPIVSFQEALQNTTSQESILLESSGTPFRASSHTSVQNIFIGPEGGFSPSELSLSEQYHLKRISLGSRVLRSETAAIAASSLFLLTH